MTSSVTGLRRSSKALPKAKLAPRKGHSHWWSAAHLIHYSFLNPGETIISEKYAQQIDEVQRNLQCFSWDWSTEWAQFFSTTTPNHTLHNQCFKSWMNWATKYCLIHHIHLTSHQPTTTSSSILTTFFQGECFHNQQEAENAFQEFIESWSMKFYTTGINHLISHWQKCVDCNGSYFER